MKCSKCQAEMDGFMRDSIHWCPQCGCLGYCTEIDGHPHDVLATPTNPNEAFGKVRLETSLVEVGLVLGALASLGGEGKDVAQRILEQCLKQFPSQKPAVPPRSPTPIPRR